MRQNEWQHCHKPIKYVTVCNAIASAELNKCMRTQVCVYERDIEISVTD